MSAPVPAFERFLDALRAIWTEVPDNETRMRRALPELEALVRDGTLQAVSRTWPSTEGRKNLRLYADPEHGFVVNAVIRVPGRKGSVHDHADAWVLYGVLDGTESLERYERLDGGAMPGHAAIRLVSVTTGTQGKADLVAPYAIHAEQGGPTRSAAIIVRSRPLGEGTVLQNAYDLETGRVEQRYGPTQIPFAVTL